MYFIYVVCFLSYLLAICLNKKTIEKRVFGRGMKDNSASNEGWNC